MRGSMSELRHPTPTECRELDARQTEHFVRANACRFRDGRCLTRASLYDEAAAAADSYRLDDPETHGKYARALQALMTHHCEISAVQDQLQGK